MKTDNFVSFVHCPFPVPKLELVQYVFYELICLKNAVLYGGITSFLSSGDQPGGSSTGSQYVGGGPGVEQ